MKKPYQVIPPSAECRKTRISIHGVELPGILEMSARPGGEVVTLTLELDASLFDYGDWRNVQPGELNLVIKGPGCT